MGLEVGAWRREGNRIMVLVGENLSELVIDWSGLVPGSCWHHGMD